MLGAMGSLHRDFKGELRGAAEAVEADKEHYAEDGVHERSDGKMHVEPSLRLVQQEAAHNRQDRLVHNVENSDERKSCQRMLGIQPRPNRGSRWRESLRLLRQRWRKSHGLPGQ